MEKRRYSLLILLAFAAFADLSAQVVRGSVKDEHGDYMIGATVREKGTSNGTVTDVFGNFILKVSKIPTTLVTTALGYDPLETTAEGAEVTINLVKNDNILNEVNIVGTRNTARTKTTTIAPVDVINIAEVTNRQGQVEVNQLLQFVAPSFNSNRQTGSDGADHIDPASLRGLGPDQTLVLVNGKRYHQSSLVNIYGSRGRGNTGTDLNTIPASAIERIEILRDGAAAQYGSDAIAGVINIVLKSNTNRFEANASVGAHQAKYRFDDDQFDGLAYNLGLNYGFTVLKDGFVNATFDHNAHGHTNRANTHEEIYRRQFGDPKMRNTALVLNTSLPLSSKTSAYGNFGYNIRNGDAYAWTRFADDDRNVPAIYPDGFDPVITSRINDMNFTAGLRTRLKHDWTIDLSNTNGFNDFQFGVENTLNRSLGASSPTKFNAGGFRLDQNTTNLDITKQLHAGTVGINVAVGAEYRLEKYSINAGEEKSWKSYDSNYPAGSQGYPGFQPGDEVDADRNNLGLYGDLEFDLTKQLTAELALRYEDYSDFGNTFNYKGALRYQFAEEFAVRGTYSTGFRAPSLPQINYQQTVTNFIAGQPVEVLIARNNSAVTNALGIEKLKQETSKNLSAGITGRISNRFSYTLDVYQIEVKDRIVLTGQFSKDDSIINVYLTNLNVGKAQFFTNAVNTTTRGVDAVLVYSLPRLTGPNDKLNLTLAANFNKLEIDAVNTNDKLKGKEDTYFDLREQYFLRASAPESKISLGLDYEIKNTNINLRLTQFGKVTLADWNYDPNALNVYDPKMTVDLSLSHKFKNNMQWTIGASNLLNAYPNIFDPALTESGGAWDPVQMGNNGAYYFARVRFSDFWEK